MNSEVADLTILVSTDQMRSALHSLGQPATLDETYVFMGMQAFMALVSGNIVRLEDGRAVHLVDVEEPWWG